MEVNNNMVSDGMTFRGISRCHFNSHEAHTSVVNVHCVSHGSILYVFWVKVVIPGHVHRGQGEEKVGCFKGLKVVLNGRLKRWVWAAQCGKYDPAEISRSWLIRSLACAILNMHVSLLRRFSPVFFCDCFRLWLNRPLHKGLPRHTLNSSPSSNTHIQNLPPSLLPWWVCLSLLIILGHHRESLNCLSPCCC